MNATCAILNSELTPDERLAIKVAAKALPSSAQAYVRHELGIHHGVIAAARIRALTPDPAAIHAWAMDLYDLLPLLGSGVAHLLYPAPDPLEAMS